MVWYISSGISPCFPLARGLCKFYANAGGAIQAASQSTFIIKQIQYTLPVLVKAGMTKISG
jgi:hypothetical protein